MNGKSDSDILKEFLEAAGKPETTRLSKSQLLAMLEPQVKAMDDLMAAPTDLRAIHAWGLETYWLRDLLRKYDRPGSKSMRKAFRELIVEPQDKLPEAQVARQNLAALDFFKSRLLELVRDVREGLANEFDVRIPGPKVAPGSGKILSSYVAASEFLKERGEIGDGRQLPSAE